jgi:hypothetical protein
MPSGRSSAASRSEAANRARPPPVGRRILIRPEQIVYRTAGFPVAIRYVLAGAEVSKMRSVFAHEYWHPRHLNRWLELILAVTLIPVSLPAAIIFYSARNGPVIRRREGKAILIQIWEQLKFYFAAGILPPWYYIFELHRDARSTHARDYLQRFEMGIYALLRPMQPSPLNDKREFADYCAAHDVPHVHYFAHLNGSDDDSAVLPKVDIFVKPVKARGGKGAERWDWMSGDQFLGVDGETLSADALLDRLKRKAKHAPLLIQPRLVGHSALRSLSPGALCTVRVLTCLDEVGHPEVVEAAFRMSIGCNAAVDNFHAGGIASAVSIDTGRLGPATNSGFNSKLGWLVAQPSTGIRIEGFQLPCWDEVKALALQAHRAFGDRTVVGWDIGILDSGPIVIEGNSSPDVDIHQRVRRLGLANSRFGELLSYHVREALERVTIE